MDRYTFRKNTPTQGELLGIMDGEDAWTLIVSGPIEAVRKRYDALMAAKD